MTKIVHNLTLTKLKQTKQVAIQICIQLMRILGGSTIYKNDPNGRERTITFGKNNKKVLKFLKLLFWEESWGSLKFWHSYKKKYLIFGTKNCSTNMAN